MKLRAYLVSWFIRLFFTEIAEVAQRKIPYFRFFRIRSNLSVFVL